MKTDKTKIEDNKRPRSRVPMFLHIYVSLILVTMITGVLIWLSCNFIMQNYIASECEKRISSAVNSCQSFAEAFRNSLNPEEFGSEEQIRTNLLNSIVSSSDISNEASIVLFEDDSYTGGFNVLWPTSSYSVSARNRAQNYLNTIIENMSHASTITTGDTRSTFVDGSLVYYKFINVEYASYEGEAETEYDRYYLLVYIDTSSYYSFTTAINVSVFRAIMMAVLISTVISIIVAFPIFFSTRKLSKFAYRVGKGDFTPVKGHIMSSELSSLADTMNLMAQRLEKADLEQKTFFQNASHELRTPLMSIQGYAEGLKYDVFNEEEKNNAVDVIISETSRLSTLVENLLSISKMDMSRSGTYTVKKTIIDVRELSEDIVDRVRGNFLLDDKELITDINVSDTYICANENDVLRMLENIFSNCHRYAGKHVYFFVSRKKDKVTFVISDDGPGISEQLLPTLFDRFAKGSDGKHGIGLALAKAIAQESGGNITAGNRPEGGAEFVITLPTIAPKVQLSHRNNEG